MIDEDEDSLRNELARLLEQFETNPSFEHATTSASEIHSLIRFLDDIASFRQSWDDHKPLMEMIRHSLDPDQPIFGCASCGDVHEMQMEQEHGCGPPD